MSVRAILDVLMPALEPNGSKRDDSRARFVVIRGEAEEAIYAQPGILYGWPRREEFVPEGDGSLDDERFFIRLAWAVDAEIEIASMERDRATSEVLFDKVEEIAAWVRANRTSSAWEQLRITEVDYEGLVTNSVRGCYLDLDGYVLLT